ncbi:hypothetical protein PHISP_03590 [Aspergillus sp. HF37]|nr:hypothetical protein PHISP_03590 [Aspergillus sp. HF37]
MPYSAFKLSLALLILMTAAVAAQSDSHEATIHELQPVLHRNQTATLSRRNPQSDYGCGISEQSCGSGCIPVLYTCCPDENGGCALDMYCSMGDNGKYGCCPMMETCYGDGGVDNVDDWDDIDEDTTNDDNDSYVYDDYSDDARAVRPGPGLAGVFVLVTLVGML